MKKFWLLGMLALLMSSSAWADHDQDEDFHEHRHKHHRDYDRDDDGDVEGYIFEDFNFGGTPRYFSPDEGMAAMSLLDIHLRLTNVRNPRRYYNASTGSDGYFKFDDVPNGQYRLTFIGRGVTPNDQDGELYSVRGDCDACLPVQVYPAVSEQYGLDVEVNGDDVNASMGFSYSVVNNNKDSGVGSLRQFLINTTNLVNGRYYRDPQLYYLTKQKLRQREGHRSGMDNAIFTSGIGEIDLLSPLKMVGVAYTAIDSQPKLGRPLSIRSNGYNINGLQLVGSSNIVLAGINWHQFSGALYLHDSHEINISQNSFSYISGPAVKIQYGDKNQIASSLFDTTAKRSLTPQDSAAVIILASSENEVSNNAFVDTGRGDPRWKASAVRIADGVDNLISQNTFNNTTGIAIDLGNVAGIGIINKNNGAYDWDSNVSNFDIDYPILDSVSSVGDVTGRVRLDNIAAGQRFCRQTMSDIKVELYKADGQASNSTLEGTAFLGTCSLNRYGDIQNCQLNTSRFHAGDQITAITIDHCGNTSEMGQSVIAGGGGNFDYGDAPNEDLATGWEQTQYPVMSYDNGARHTITQDTCLLPHDATSCVFHITQDADGKPSRYATKDQDDDGLLVNPNLHLDGPGSMRVLMTGYLDQSGHEQDVDNTLVINASKAGYISVWLDRNQDGKWVGFVRNRRFVSEQILVQKPVKAGENVFNVNLSAYDVHGESFLRVRYSTDAAAINQTTGAAPDGEVEDYQVWIAAPSLKVAGCEAGLQNGSFEHFYIETDNNGWDTPESSVAGWSIVQLDPTLPTQNYEPKSRRNHIEFNRYNQYVATRSSDGTLNVAEMNVYNPTLMYQDIVTTPGEKIRWSFDYSNRTRPKNRYGDQISLMFGSPNAPLEVNQTINGQDEWKTYSGLYTVPAGQYITRIAFRGNLPSSSSSGNILDAAKFGCQVGYDYGDLPEQYSSITDLGYKVSPELYIGNEAPDVELGAQESETASGDDLHGFNDEFTFDSPLIIKRSNQVELKIPVFNNTGKNAMLNAWIDYNRDGYMSSSENTRVWVRSSSQPQVISVVRNGINGNKWTDDDSTFLRLTLNQGDIGEVEDHQIYLTNEDLFPKPGRCDGFIQVKAPYKNGIYQYAKWVTADGELAIQDINPSLGLDEIKVVGVNPIDGLTYAVGMDSAHGCRGRECEMHLFVADQQPRAEFSHLAPIRAARDGVEIHDRFGNVYKFDKGEVLTTGKKSQNSNRRLSRPNVGDVSLDGRYMVVGQGGWYSLLKVDLATGLFDTIRLTSDELKGGGLPWGPDVAFNPKDGNSDYVYALAADLHSLFRIAMRDISSAEPAGSFVRLPLTLKLSSDKQVTDPQWPIKDGQNRLAAGGIGINRGGVMFAMTNGGFHDLNQDGVLESGELRTQTTALYSIDIAKQIIRFEMKGVDQTTQSNDAGGCAIHADYGDAPSSLEGGNPARHLGGNEDIRLGQSWSADIGPGNDPMALSDLSDDGVRLRDRATNEVVSLQTQPLIPGKSYAIELIQQGGGYASAWVNWGSNNSWRKISNLSQGIQVPLDAYSHGDRGYIRVRYSRTPINTPYGEAPDGEVEDYSFVIGNPINAIAVKAPGSPLTCEVAPYKVILDVDGGELTDHVDVQLSFDNPPSQCWFSGSEFARGNASSQSRCSQTQTIQFDKNGSLERTIWVATDSELQPVKLVATLNNVGTASASARFSKTGFKLVPYKAPKYYKAGEDFNLQVVRQIALEDQHQCAIDPDYQGEKPFDFAFDNGGEAVTGKLALQGQLVDAGGERRSLNFSNGVSEVIPASYTESGRLNISAQTHPDQGLVKKGSLSLDVQPYALVVWQNYQTNKPNVVSHYGSQPFVSAGTPFSVEVAAVAKDGVITQNFDGQLAASNDGFSSSVVTPTSQAHAKPALNSPSGLNRVFRSGVLTNQFEYDNVGAIKTRWIVSNYRGYQDLDTFLDTSIDHKLANHDVVGYFYPHHFMLSQNFSVPMEHGGQAWTYYGKPDVALNVDLKALSANNHELSFYDASKMAADELPRLAQLAMDFGDSQVPSCNQTLLVDDAMHPVDFNRQWANGEWHLPAQTYQFYRDHQCRESLHDVQPQITLEDNVPGITVPVYQAGAKDNLADEAIKLGEPVDVLFGRLAIKNASGPINQLLPMAIEAQYWHNGKFTVNDWDNSTQIGAGLDAQLPDSANVKVVPAATDQTDPKLMADSLSVGTLENGLVKTIIGADGPGHAVVPMRFSQGAEKWLGYCWAIDGKPSNELPNGCSHQSSFWQPPTAIATFGVSNGSSNVIYFKERYD